MSYDLNLEILCNKTNKNSLSSRELLFMLKLLKSVDHIAPSVKFIQYSIWKMQPF